MLDHIGDTPAVILGDLIDRGPASDRVLDLAMTAPGNVTCLMGNHERMLLDFLDAPEAAPRWLAHGGLATLASYGIDGGIDRGTVHDRAALAAALRDAWKPGVEPWLRSRPLLWRSGTLVAAHAGLDRRRSVARQTEAALLWGKGVAGARDDGLWVAHGHDVVETAGMAHGRIALDTGAWRTGRLTGARIGAGTVRFFQA